MRFDWLSETELEKLKFSKRLQHRTFDTHNNISTDIYPLSLLLFVSILSSK